MTTVPTRETASAVYQVFSGAGTARLGELTYPIESGDMFVVPSWTWHAVVAGPTEQLDLFRFADTPIFTALRQYRRETPMEHSA